ncbi:MAG: 5-dehydro-4-deoxy-D-glucuronate isomerase [Oscillospiraceae bacterium]|jgi:4-deoxy-L-threo-5-hexosulose-uronate ketol-isomerase|nr:5-dehydro-4-deoxy-D-glucuronate isomerase [Oscillospiraceae bacterium]
MDIRYSVSKNEYRRMTTAELRENFLLEQLFLQDKINMAYSHYDRIIAGGAVPVSGALELEAAGELACDYFLERREMGVINIAGDGVIVADGVSYPMQKYDCLYLGRGTKEISFASDSAENPAVFYLNSTPAHKEYPTVHIPKSKAVQAALGSSTDCNERIIYKYILPGNVESCQLVMGLTILAEGSVWNTMPTHTHERRMEVYLYFDVPESHAVIHLMGPGDETRHITVKNRQAVISPSWSIHSGVGTKNYTFIWGMCGENQAFDDMQGIRTEDLL